MTTKKKKTSLTWSMVGMLLLGWFLPVLLIAFGMLDMVSGMLSTQIERTIIASTDNAVELCEMKLEEAWTASKAATYDSTISNAYFNYMQKKNSQTLYTDITYYLNQQYKYDSGMLCTMVFLTREPKQIYYTYNTFQNTNGGNEGYSRVTYFEENLLAEVMELSAELDTDARLIFHEGHLYMIRNLVDISFRPYAMIVIELNPDDMFGGLNSVWGFQSYQVYLEGEPIVNTSFPTDHVLPAESLKQSTYITDEESNYSYKEMSFGEQTLICAVQINRESVLDQVNMLNYIIWFIIILLIPLFFMIFHFFNRKVTRPMKDLVGAAQEIAEGNYGHQIATNATSREFDYLEQTFNSMSRELKYQFETIYEEELALKDANIMALQSQINPHFLNNTLEIINWEARMSGSDNVSGMIEALGTMLSATMNRRQKRFVTLAEELSYVDAYLYIISRRFGERFKVYRDIDESLLQLEVPMLIIQPIVENAVEHGVEAHREGMVALSIRADWDSIVIEVKNDGGLTEENKKRIDFLLNSEEHDENEHHVSLGIRNVNRRVKIIYGEECGLTIENDNHGHTVSRIVVKMVHDGSKEPEQ